MESDIPDWSKHIPSEPPPEKAYHDWRVSWEEEHLCLMNLMNYRKASVTHA